MRRAAAVLAVAALSWTLMTMTGGCAPLRSAGLLPGAPEPTPAAPAPDRAEGVLIEAAVRAETALAALARTSEGALAPVALPRIVPRALLRRVTVDFTGPLETLVAALAERAGYELVIAGTAPVRPLLVEVTVEEELLIAVLRDAGLQAGAAAAVVVDATGRRIYLDWAGSTTVQSGDAP